MPTDSRRLAVKNVLDLLCSQCGCSDYGYRMQAVFAHVLLRLGARILAVNAQGHPDVMAELGDRKLFVQVKTIWHAYAASRFVLSQGDLGGISPMDPGEGYLAVLDCALPVDWLLIPENRARLFVGRPCHVATLRAERIEPLSAECTDVFLDLVLAEHDRLQHLSFSVLTQRALRGQPL